MQKRDIVDALSRHNGELSSYATDSDEWHYFEERRYDYVSLWDCEEDMEAFSEDTGLSGPTDLTDGIITMWFDGEDSDAGFSSDDFEEV